MVKRPARKKGEKSASYSDTAAAALGVSKRADHHARRRRILIAKGIVHAEAGRPKKGDKLSSYSDEAAAALGVDKRTVQRDLARGENIAPDVLKDVTGTDLDKGVVLDELARLPAAEQRRILEKRSRRVHGPLELDQPG